MKKKSPETNQTQTVTQSTTVNVQNIIEDKGLDPLEKFQILGNVFARLDEIEIAKQNVGTPAAAVSIFQPSALAFLQDPAALLMIGGITAAIILLVKKV